jgi:hypothetical protein
MRSSLLLVAAAVMLTAPLVIAQDGRARQRSPGGSGSSGGGAERSAPRAAAPRSEPRSEPRSAPREQPQRQRAPQAERQADQGRRAEPQGQRQAGEGRRTEVDQRPQQAVADQAQRQQAQRQQTERRAAPRDRAGDDSASRPGYRPTERPNGGGNTQANVAVPRRGPAPSARDRYDERRYGNRNNGRTVYVYPRTNVYTYYNYPRRYFPFGYAGYGPGYYYYDSRDWYPYRAYDSAYRFNYYRDGYATGEVRLDVDERFAEVWVDGYYAGTVDDFDGIFQGLTLEEGTYEIEIAAPGYEPLIFNVRIYPGQKITYRGDLLRARQGVRY